MVRNIPVFTTEYGIASLTLEEIPYKKEAYIRIQSSVAPQQLLNECVDFCRFAGADHIYATGEESLSRYPLHATILRMVCDRALLPTSNADLVPVQVDTLDRWRMIFNQKMAGVSNAATMTASAAKQVLEQGEGYFVYQGDTLIGIGKAQSDTVDAIIALIPGAGETVMLALCSVLATDRVFVEVASDNHRAVKLYHKLGFAIEKELSSWYKIV